MEDYLQATSTAISSARYDDRTYELTITFTSGATYVYDLVFGDIWEEFKQSESKGRYFIQEIREFFPYRRVG